MKDWFVIVNPKANSGKIEKDWIDIKSLLDINLNYELNFTNRRYHAVELVVSALKKGYKKILAIGGDGTINDVLHGVFLQKDIPLSEITLGYINAKMDNYIECVLNIALDKAVMKDVFEVKYYESKVLQQRYVFDVETVTGRGIEDITVSLLPNSIRTIHC